MLGRFEEKEAFERIKCGGEDMRKYWISLFFLTVGFYGEEGFAVAAGGPSYAPVANNGLGPLFQGLLGWGPQTGPSPYPPMPQPYAQSPFPSNPSPSVQPNLLSYAPQPMLPQQPNFSLLGTLNHVLQQPQQQAPAPNLEQEERALWDKVYAQIYERASVEGVLRTLGEVENWARSRNVFTPANFLAFATNVRTISPSTIPSQNAAQPFYPQQTSTPEAFATSLVEACIFTGNAALFAALVERLVGQDSALAESLLGTLSKRPASPTGALPLPSTKVGQNGGGQKLSSVRATLTNRTTARVLPYGIRDGALPSPEYDSLLHYILENQKIAEFETVLRVFDRLPEAPFQNVMGALLYQTGAFFCQHKIALQNAFWEKVPDKMLDALFAYEGRPKGDGSSPEPLLFVAAKAGRFDLLKILINRGANTEVKAFINGQPYSFVAVIPASTLSAKNPQSATLTSGTARAINTRTSSTVEDTQALDFAVWFFKGMGREHLTGPESAHLCLDFLRVLPAQQRLRLFEQLKDSAFLTYFLQTIATAEESVIDEFLGTVSPKALIPWLTKMSAKELGWLLSRMKDRDLQALMRAMLGLPETNASQGGVATSGAYSTSGTKAKPLSFNALDVLWAVPDVHLQARLASLLIRFEEVDPKGMRDVLQKMASDATLPFLQANLEQKSRKEFLELLPKIANDTLAVRFMSPLLAGMPELELAQQEREALLTSLSDETFNGLIQGLFQHSPENVVIPKSVALLLQNSSNPAFVTRVFGAAITQVDGPDDLLACLSSDMLPRFVKLWVQPSGETSKTQRNKPVTVRDGTQKTSSRQVRRSSSQSDLRTTSPTVPAISVNADRLNTLLTVRRADLSARVVSILLELDALSPKTLSQTLQDMSDEALTTFLETALDRTTRTPIRGKVLAFLETGDAETVAQIIDVVDYLNQDRQVPLLELTELMALFEKRTDSTLMPLVKALFDINQNQLPALLGNLFAIGQKADVLARLLTTVVDLSGGATACDALLKQLTPSLLHDVLAKMSDAKLNSLVTALASSRNRDGHGGLERVSVLCKQVQDPVLIVRLLTAAATVQTLDEGDLDGLLMPLPDDMLKKVLEALLGATPQSAPAKRGSTGKGGQKTVDRSALLQKMRSPDFVVRALKVMDDTLLTYMPQTALGTYMTVLMSLEAEDTEAQAVAIQVLQHLARNPKLSEKLGAVLKSMQPKMASRSSAYGTRDRTLTLPQTSWQMLLETAVENGNGAAVSALLNFARPTERSGLGPWKRYYATVLLAANDELIAKEVFRKERDGAEKIVKQLIHEQATDLGLSGDAAAEYKTSQWQEFTNSAARGW